MISPIYSVKKLLLLPGNNRSNQWPTIRKHHLQKEWWCRYCGSTKNLEVHHIEPFHINPSKELDDNNLITLCESINKECHLKVGHLGNWKNFNTHVKNDAHHTAPPIKVFIKKPSILQKFLNLFNKSI